MPNPVTTEFVWGTISKELFGILSMVTLENEARSVGIVYIVQDRKLYIGTGTKTWKSKHIKKNPNVSMTIPIPKRIPLLPWIKIPQATISFSGTAKVIPAIEVDAKLLHSIFRHFADDLEFVAENYLIEVTPQDDFVTYGVGIPLMKMMKPELARGRAPVS